MRDLAVDSGAGLLFISHDLSVVRLIADRIAVMYLGTIVEVGDTAEVWADPRHPYTRALLARHPQARRAGRAARRAAGRRAGPGGPAPGLPVQPALPARHGRVPGQGADVRPGRLLAARAVPSRDRVNEPP